MNVTPFQSWQSRRQKYLTEKENAEPSPIDEVPASQKIDTSPALSSGKGKIKRYEWDRT